MNEIHKNNNKSTKITIKFPKNNNFTKIVPWIKKLGQTPVTRNKLCIIGAHSSFRGTAILFLLKYS